MNNKFVSFEIIPQNMQNVDVDFNIKIYREKLNEKYARSPISSKLEPTTPIKKRQQSDKAPTFDSLQNRLRDYSFNRLRNTQSEVFLFKDHQQNRDHNSNGSPSRVSGMQQKLVLNLNINRISQIGSINGFGSIKSSGRQTSMYNGPITTDRVTSSSQLELQKQQSPFRQARFETETAEKLHFEKTHKPITSVVPLHEIVNLRNKIEQAGFGTSNLTPTYTSEMVRLAQAITSQLQQKKK